MDTAFATVAELSAAFIKRTLSPVDVVDQLFGRIDGMNPGPHAVIDVYGADLGTQSETIRIGCGRHIAFARPLMPSHERVEHRSRL